MGLAYNAPAKVPELFGLLLELPTFFVVFLGLFSIFDYFILLRYFGSETIFIGPHNIVIGHNDITTFGLVLIGGGLLVASFLALLTRELILDCCSKAILCQRQSILRSIKLGLRLSLRNLIWICVGWLVRPALTIIRKWSLFDNFSNELLGVPWNNISILTIPVAMYEKMGLFSSLVRSAQLFKNRSSQDHTGLIGIGIIRLFTFFVLSVAVGALLALGNPAANDAAIIVFIVGFSICVILFAISYGFLQASIYLFVTTGHAGPHLTEAELESIFYLSQPPEIASL